jgi:anti-sigma B factor antagonist
LLIRDRVGGGEAVPDFRFPVTLAGDVPVVGTPEEIDATNAEGLRAAMLEAAGIHRVTVVDMTKTRFCDSAGIHVLVEAHKRARGQDGEVMLVLTDTAVLRVLAITGVDRRLPNFSTLDEALASVADPITASPEP